MDTIRHYSTVVIAVIAVLLQIILAPNIAVGSIVPNFILTFIVAFAMVRFEEPHYVLAFVMGLLADLWGDGPVGLGSLCLLIAVFAVSMAVQALGNDNLVMSFVVLLVTMLCINVAYSLYWVIMGSMGLSASLLHIALPCTVYDALIGLLWYAIVLRFAASSMPQQGDTPNIRFN